MKDVQIKNIAVFLDRDGTINKDKGYICDCSDLEIYSYAAAAIKEIKGRGYKVLVATNQACIARAICTEQQVQDIHAKMDRALRSAGATIDRFYYSPYHEEGVIPEFTMSHSWRKPLPGMLLQGAEDFDLDLSRSYMVGDSARDIIAGKKAGCRTILVMTGHGPKAREELSAQGDEPDFIAADLQDALQYIE